MGHLRTAAALLAALALAACADPSRDAGGPVPSPTEAAPPDGPDALVLRVDQVGGYTTPGADAARLPMVSVYADGRVFGLGPVAAIWPGFAWPNLQVRQIPVEQVRDLVARALAAGVADTTDPGSPPLADVTTTRFTLVTAEERVVREVYALREGATAGGLTDDQRAVRAELLSLLDELQDVAQPFDGSPAVYEAPLVAAVVAPWIAPEDDGSGLRFDGPPRAWPGPPLPGEPIGPDIGCVVAAGDEATAVRAAADGAHVLTPWETPDGALWSVTFRPLLPDESTCADLLR
ncbi:MAG: hypothetical protein JHC71_01640 [Blastococcus sp.]|nr:hypothetical protein [Blastococcus sp.]